MKYIYIILSIIICSSCNDFDEINTNPNAATKVSSSLLATPLILDITTTVNTAAGFIDDNCLAKQIVWFEYLNNYNYNYLGRAGLSYQKLINANKMVELAEPDTKDTYEALALFIKSYKFFYFSMRMGDIPYSEALKGEMGVLKPKYDTQESIMIDILKNLERSSMLFSSCKNFTGDPLLQGEPLKWKKVVDAFRLKVLMYLSKKESNTELNVKEQFAQIYTEGSLMQSNNDNLQRKFSDKAGQIYPFNRSVSNHYFYCVISNVMTDMLKDLNDYRLFYFAQPANSKLKDGCKPNDMEAYIGLDPTKEFASNLTKYSSGECSLMNLRYTDIATGEPYSIIGYAEQQFILAEAALRGWIKADTEKYYNNGIMASMNYITENTPDEEKYHYGMKMTNDYISAYINSDKVKLQGSFDDKVKLIISQKYITSYMQYPYDAYFEYRRTGFPELPINPETNRNSDKTKIPVRWMYPIREFDYNQQNLKDAVDRQFGGLDDNNQIMWILK